MDVAYDQIQKESLSPREDSHAEQDQKDGNSGVVPELRKEFGEAYKSFTESSWGSRLGGLWGTVKKQGESYYEGARAELSSASEASKGFTDLTSSTQHMTLSQEETNQSRSASAEQPQETAHVPESLPKDIVKEAESMLVRFRSEAAVRLKQVQKAEDAADEALLKFGSNIKDYLRDAVTITAPTEGNDGEVKSVLFESKDAEGKRVVHATRFDAQLHVIHSTLNSFTKPPESGEYPKWEEGFDVDKKTDAIAQDLAKYPELRQAMEKVVPQQVGYSEFWCRYYFLRHVIETEEQKRKELLLKTQSVDEEVNWDDEDEEEDKAPATPKIKQPGATTEKDKTSDESKESSSSADLLKPNEGRRSNENSVADSDASYDIVSGATSRGPGSPRDEKEGGVKRAESKTGDQSDEEDWE